MGRVFFIEFITILNVTTLEEAMAILKSDQEEHIISINQSNEIKTIKKLFEEA